MPELINALAEMSRLDLFNLRVARTQAQRMYKLLFQSESHGLPSRSEGRNIIELWSLQLFDLVDELAMLWHAWLAARLVTLSLIF